MEKFDRIFELHRILSARRTPIALENLFAKLALPSLSSASSRS
jgi:hypothetical protein